MSTPSRDPTACCLPPAAYSLVPRDPALRAHYLTAALANVPRLLGAIDRNPFRATYGCMDRQFWHYRTASFPSEMFQEGVLPLALVFARELPGNRWFGDQRVRELAIAALQFSARSCHADGSCDDYYPWERALGAAVFSLQAAVRCCEVLGLDDPAILAWLERRARWLMRHDESGRLANHHALAAVGLLGVARLTGKSEFAQAAEACVARVLSWQHAEGWFDEYGGADPGYQTVTIDCLARYARQTAAERLREPLARAVRFARLFLHPDASYAGEYGSRGTYHFYPHGMELLAPELPEAADLADGHLRSLATGRCACFGDDRLYAHRTANWIEAYLDWSSHRAAPEPEPQGPTVQWLPAAGLLVRRDGPAQTVVSTARGGVFKHFASSDRPTTDAGLIVETTDGRVAVSQMHDPGRTAVLDRSLSVTGPLHWARFETATPLKQAVFHLGLWAVGRWCRTLVRMLLQRRLITGRRRCPIRLTRRFEWHEGPGAGRLRVVDTIELTDRSLQVRRMAFGCDHQAAYVAASGVYQDSVLHAWTDLAGHVERLNAERHIEIIRDIPQPPPR